MAMCGCRQRRQQTSWGYRLADFTTSRTGWHTARATVRHLGFTSLKALSLMTIWMNINSVYIHTVFGYSPSEGKRKAKLSEKFHSFFLPHGNAAGFLYRGMGLQSTRKPAGETTWWPRPINHGVEGSTPSPPQVIVLKWINIWAAGSR